jgi:hypothetical protein
VAEQPGRIWVVNSNSVLAEPFLDITDRVLSTGGEQGLLGIAFPPRFATNSHFYVNYTRRPDGATVVSRFLLTTNSNVADTNSEQIIKVVPQPYENHNGGHLAFGPDGYLYIALGDGGAGGDPQNNGQKTNTLLGKLLRIDVESGAVPYAVPTNNPFVAMPGYAPEIWALGLRNPWRFSFDRTTGDLYIGDVGQNSFEEVNFQPAGSPGGQNYGWRIMEGPTHYNVPAGFTNFSALTFPVAWYDWLQFPTFGSSVTGGHVYRGPHEPRMNGIYFYADFMSGWMWGLKRDGTNWQNELLLRASSPIAHFWISTFGEDEQGRLLFADYVSGKIYQMHDTPHVWPPTFSPTNGIINSNVVFVSCLTTGAVIHLTTNGLDPVESDPVVPSRSLLQVIPGQTNKLRAFRAGLTPSAVVSAIFTLRAGTPTFTPRAGPITNNTAVSMSTVTPDATIYYTTNGSAPTSNSLAYTGPLTISAPFTIRAFALAAGYSNSQIATASYSAAQAAQPLFTPAAGPITNGSTVSISCATPGAVIYYTLDDSTPTTNSSIYSGPVAINGGTTVNAFAVANGYVDSRVRTTFYQLVQTATPAFSPPWPPVAYGTSVSISCATPGVVIYYTLDGNSPTTNSPIYSSPLIITNDVLLNAFAVAPDHLDSAVQSVFFTLTQAAMPEFSPRSGPLTNGASIAISCATSNAIIRYTLDGSDPDTNSPIYTTALSFSNSVTLKARAFAPQFNPSDIAATFFGLLSRESFVVTTFAGGTASGYSNGPARLASFAFPQAICYGPDGSFYVADSGNYVIRRILPSGEVTTLAGTGIPGYLDGPAGDAQFSTPVAVCTDSIGHVYVSDSGCHRVRKIATNAMVSTLAQLQECYYAPTIWQMETDPADNIYVGQYGTVYRVSPTGSVLGLAGIDDWHWGVGVGLDRSANVYASAKYRITRVAPDGSTEHFAGDGNGSGLADGPRLNARFQGPQDTAVDSATNILVSDVLRIRKVRPDGWVSTLAGTGVAGYRNGPGSVAQFNGTAGLCVDTNGNIYVADSGNNCIRKVSPDTAAIGIADDWQRAHFNHINIDPNADPDHDGMSNYQEFWAATDPLDPASVLAVHPASLVSNGHIQIRWQTVAGKTYSVQYSTDRLSWSTLGDPLVGDDSVASVLDPAPISQTMQRYYRVVLSGF